MNVIITCTLAAATLCSTLQAQKQSEYLSLRLEMERAIRKGNAFLKSQQGKEGFWGEKETPALTSLVLAAMMRDPGLDYTKTNPQHIERGF
ncbi:MAG: hypothetical protein QGH41_11970, partial [Roseibacillus sp.]|nr:hypothetical protein [Roseibacillus sp.]